MGVPKFFRYISERYPCLSEFVKEYQIPVFDNLYLDMNGIIHMCSHPDDNNPHFRITEEKIFKDIFHYIEVLFRMIKPQKVFFMAVDGVAPRAKMNQQRGRRFRSAKDAEKMEKEAIKKGEKLPDVDRFDSNCITPGTEFMARLHEQLKYFIVNKISTDKMWRRCEVILSGHETPGEGEHKIMDYIRYIRSQPGYDPNTRHCLYGLDADLIMLGLCTHDPHFSLLREEVKFGKKTKRSNVPEEIRFYLLHLSLMREYLELEFAPLKEKLATADKLKFDIEKVIDDWILMGFLVGNDFIPNLPNLHIANGALPVLYKAYIDVLPTLDGYINESGTLNLPRFEKFMEKLSEIDLKNFEETQEDLLYFERKTGQKQSFHTPVNCKLMKNEDNCSHRQRDPALEAMIQATDELDISSEDESDDKMSSSNEDEAFKSFKDEYYRNKLEYQKVTAEVMREQAEGYVRAIQWNLNYYYNGVCSWSWFYPHHYSPYISDIKGFSDLKIEFNLGEPFKPYEQLLAVLPTASKNLLPKCYHHLMTDEESIIKDYYPEDFQTDLNGKRQEWEAVVLVPFIDENLLLKAMKPCNESLNPEEITRNQHGPMLIYKYSEEDLGLYEAPSYFPNVRNYAHCNPVNVVDIRVPKENLVKGAYPGARFDVYYPGFPTLKHLSFESEIQKAKVKVFEMPSRNENLILKILPNELSQSDSVPLNMLGTTVWVHWPHLVEAMVVAISNRKEKFVFCEKENKKYKIEEQKLFDSELEGITRQYRDRLGIDLGKTKFLVHVQLMIGRKYVFTSGRRVNLEKQFTNIISSYPLQSVVTNIRVYDECYSTFTDICDIFPIGTTCFSLTHPHYGSQGTIMDSKDTLKNNNLKVLLHIAEEPDFKAAQKLHDGMRNNYLKLNNSASQLALSNYVFSRITGSLFISTRTVEGILKSVNIGLDLKFNKKNQETPGYTRKIDNIWHYTNKAVYLVRSYVEKFPEVFEYLSTSEADELSADSVFKEDGDEKVKSIQTWLKTLPTYNLERRMCGSEVLEFEIVEAIEKSINQIHEDTKDLVMNIKPHMLYKPGIQMGSLCPDSLTITKVFDRVVNVREGFSVPLGLKGTVIAIHKSTNVLSSDDDMYDIVFDKPFSGGMALNCSEYRGYRLPKFSFINLSYGKRQMEQKTGIPGALRALAKEKRSTDGSVSNGNISTRQQNSAFASFNKTPPHVATSFSCENFLYTTTQNQVRQQPINPSCDQQKSKNSFYYMADYTRGYDSKVNKENSVNRNNATAASVHRNQGRIKESPVPPQNQISSNSRTEVDTDFLKRILNIQSNVPSSKRCQNSETLPNQSISSNRKVQNPNAPNINAGARLLNYYQSNLLGCPRYTYLERDDGFSAQVVLPNGKVITGKTARTREDASENVALDALNLLTNKTRTPKEGLPSQFPVPPTKWVQERQMQNKMPSHVFVNKSFQPRPHQTFRNHVGDRSKGDLPTNFNRNSDNIQYNLRDGVNTNSHNFVPLQALKKRPGNKNTGYLPKTTNADLCYTKKENGTSKSTIKSTNVSKECGSNVKEMEKSSKQRKTRIAANFNK